MKRLVALLLTAVMAFGLTACMTDVDDAFELALITDVGTIDDRSFNQGSWEGLVQFAEANNITHTYIQPASVSDHAYLNAIEQAVELGARLIVTPGFLFEVAIWEAQELFPDTKFVLIDGQPRNPDRTDWTIRDNVVGVFFAEEEAGFLAGYAAIMEGFRELGFIGGMAVPAVVRFGYGFLQGIEYAAAQLGLDNVNVNYFYTGDFEATPATQTLAAAWFNAGIEVIFACGGALGNSVMAAAEHNNGVVIGVDIDQSYESPTVITSALKGLTASVYSIITDFYAGNFPGGQVLNLTAAENGVGLPMETSRFENFTQEQYDAIFARLVAGEIDIISDHTITIDDLGLSIVNVTFIN